MDDSAIICYRHRCQTTEKLKLFQEVLMKRMPPVTRKIFIFYLHLLITITLLIAVSIYCYLIKYRAKQKHLLPFHFTNNKLKI